MDREKEKLIESYKNKIKYDKNYQRAEILKQNNVFKKEFSGIKKRLGKNFFKCLDEGIPPPVDFVEPRLVNKFDPHNLQMMDPSDEKYVFARTDPFFDASHLDDVEVEDLPVTDDIFFATIKGDSKSLSSAAKRLCQQLIFDRYLEKWSEFCTKWNISKDWNRNINSLPLYSLDTVIVEIDSKNYNFPVVIRLGTWATRRDVEKAWMTVKKKMKEAKVQRERGSKNFLRDKIWHILNKKFGMSPLEIARLWAKRFPKEIENEIIMKITKDDEDFKNMEPEQRLIKIRSGDKQMEEIKSEFDTTLAKYLDSGLKDKVKKSIYKTERKVKPQVHKPVIKTV